jgi:hypothetical protein
MSNIEINNDTDNESTFNSETDNESTYNSETDNESTYNSETDNQTDNESTYNSETDNESTYDSEDEEINYNLYQPEEISLTKYNIVICEKYNTQFHGMSTDDIIYHYLTHIRYKRFNFNEMKNIIRCVLTRSKIEIAECIYLPSQYCISILKTFWIKLIQRKWKNILKQRENIIKKRYNINSIIYRELHGKWPIDCLNYPRLKGMLSNLLRTSF